MTTTLEKILDSKRARIDAVEKAKQRISEQYVQLYKEQIRLRNEIETLARAAEIVGQGSKVKFIEEGGLPEEKSRSKETLVKAETAVQPGKVVAANRQKGRSGFVSPYAVPLVGFIKDVIGKGGEEGVAITDVEQQARQAGYKAASVKPCVSHLKSRGKIIHVGKRYYLAGGKADEAAVHEVANATAY